MYPKFFRAAALIIFAVFVVCRLFVTNGLINDIVLSAAILLFLLLSLGGLLFDKSGDEAERRSYRKFAIAFAVILAVWILMLLTRYVFTA